MEDLHELVKIVAGEQLNKVDDLRDIVSDKKGNAKIQRLYRSILNGKAKTDSEAAVQLSLQEGGVAFRSIKSRLTKLIRQNCP